jgi:bidirectional [NiFe] hydrogenase diaphorase subunit
MAISTKRLAAPSDDKRWKIVDVTMRRHGYQANALIETLHTAQECFGFLDDSTLRFVSSSLDVPLSKVYGVATFYHLFTLKPQGKHSCVVCTGTACYIKGARELLKGIRETYGVKPGETTGDNRLSLMHARCLGACGLAPAVVVDGNVMGDQTASSLLAALQEVVRHES